jgi:hypothetical protein
METPLKDRWWFTLIFVAGVIVSLPFLIYMFDVLVQYLLTENIIVPR